MVILVRNKQKKPDATRATWTMPHPRFKNKGKNNRSGEFFVFVFLHLRVPGAIPGGHPAPYPEDNRRHTRRTFSNRGSVAKTLCCWTRRQRRGGAKGMWSSWYEIRACLGSIRNIIL